jgi:hypothetical protein
MTKDLPQNKTLFWRVRGKNALVLGTWSANRSFTTGNPPAVPVLVSPANNMLVTDYTPLFNWSNVLPAPGTSFKYYEIEADDNIDFSSPEVSATTTLNDATNSEYQQGSDLASNTKFYWRVRAFNTDDHFSGWSTVWYLRMAILPPQNITKVDNPDPTKPLKPSFTWDPATGPGTISNYTIQISTVSNFSSLLVNATTINPSYSLINNLPAGKTIYWRVRVNGANGPSAWSTASFTTP